MGCHKSDGEKLMMKIKIHEVDDESEYDYDYDYDYEYEGPYPIKRCWEKGKNGCSTRSSTFRSIFSSFRVQR